MGSVRSMDRIHSYVNEPNVMCEHVEHAPQPTKSLRQSVRLVEIIPRTFSQYYDPKVYANPANIDKLGRPKFTKRALVDYLVNDIRSLLFVHELQPEWKGRLPTIREGGFRCIYLALDASDTRIIETLANSDLYKEHPLSMSTRLYIAKAALQGAKRETGRLSLIEWRRMLETYLLNLGCEAQTIIDYRAAIERIRSRRISAGTRDCDKLRSNLRQLRGQAQTPAGGERIQVSLRERKKAWTGVQRALYQRLGLEWEVDSL